MTEELCSIWLSEALPKGSAVINEIYSQFENAYEFYESVKSGKYPDHITETNLRRILKTNIKSAQSIKDKCDSLGIKIMVYNSPDYPESLKNIFGIPPVLYYFGNAENLNVQASLGVVGTRHACEMSMKVTGAICRELSAAGINIVSGCAVGIDEYAHRGALKGRTRTIGVLACGADVNYPAANAALKNRILSAGGLLITELPPGTRPSRGYFSARNRLIAGLSDAVFVTEAPARSGALITAEHALQQGKELFCMIPLEYANKRFDGVVKYLRNGAHPVFDASDIVIEYYINHAHKLNVEYALEIIENAKTYEELRYSGASLSEERINNPVNSDNSLKNKKPPVPEGLTKNAELLYNAVSCEHLYAQELAEKSGLNIAQVLAAVTELEINGIIKSDPGKRYYIEY